MPFFEEQRIIHLPSFSRIFTCSDEDYGGWGKWKTIQQLPPTTFMDNIYDVRFSAVFPYPVGNFMDLFTWLHGKLRAMVRKMVERPEDTNLLVIQEPKIDDVEMRNRTGRRISISARVSFEPVPITNGLMRFEQSEIREYIRWAQARTGLNVEFCGNYEPKKISLKTEQWIERWHKR